MAGVAAGAKAGARAGAVGGPLQPSQRHNIAGGAAAIATASGSGAKIGAITTAATKLGAAVVTRPGAEVKTHHPGGHGIGGLKTVSGSAAAASAPGNSTAPSTGQRTAPAPGPRTAPGTALHPGHCTALAAVTVPRTTSSTAKASAPASAVRGRLVSGLGLKPHHPLAASLEARGQLKRASTAPAPAHAPPAGAREAGSGAAGRRGGVAGAAAAAAAVAVGVSRAAAAAAGTGRSAMQAAFGDLAGKVVGEDCQSR